MAVQMAFPTAEVFILGAVMRHGPVLSPPASRDKSLAPCIWSCRLLQSKSQAHQQIVDAVEGAAGHAADEYLHVHPAAKLIAVCLRICRECMCLAAGAQEKWAL